MDTPTKKRWWKSKTIWSGVGTIGIGIYSIFAGNPVAGISAIATGLGTIFGRVTATQEIKVEPSN